MESYEAKQRMTSILIHAILVIFSISFRRAAGTGKISRQYGKTITLSFFTKIHC